MWALISSPGGHAAYRADWVLVLIHMVCIGRYWMRLDSIPADGFNVAIKVQIPSCSASCAGDERCSKPQGSLGDYLVLMRDGVPSPGLQSHAITDDVHTDYADSL